MATTMPLGICAVHAGFELELGEGAAAADLGDDFLVAADRPFARRDHLDLPALLGGIALVHAKQIAGEQRCLVAAGAGTDFEDDVALVHRILRQQGEANLLLERGSPRFQRRLLARHQAAHLGIGRGIVQEGGKTIELAGHATIGLDGRHHRPKLGELARQPHIVGRRQLARELAFHRLMAGQEGIEFGFGQHRDAGFRAFSGKCMPWRGLPGACIPVAIRPPYRPAPIVVIPTYSGQQPPMRFLSVPEAIPNLGQARR
jgi:hypothetical protein